MREIVLRFFIIFKKNKDFALILHQSSITQQLAFIT